MKLFFFAAVLALQVSAADATTFRRTVEGGRKTYMLNYMAARGDCSSDTGIVEVITKPQHGKVSQRIAKAVFEKSRFPHDTDCSGQPVDALQVEYQPSRGYKGYDYIGLKVTFGNRPPLIDNFNILVK